MKPLGIEPRASCLRCWCSLPLSYSLILRSAVFAASQDPSVTDRLMAALRSVDMPWQRLSFEEEYLLILRDLGSIIQREPHVWAEVATINIRLDSLNARIAQVAPRSHLLMGHSRTRGSTETSLFHNAQQIMITGGNFTIHSAQNQNTPDVNTSHVAASQYFPEPRNILFRHIGPPSEFSTKCPGLGCNTRSKLIRIELREVRFCFPVPHKTLSFQTVRRTHRANTTMGSVHDAVALLTSNISGYILQLDVDERKILTALLRWDPNIFNRLPIARSRSLHPADAYYLG
ncbi:hypothetical protein CPC08DRAFT_794684 [Agrocybe pediades]|nr:hypothetical protein CPC08DRAFT_794684 [Agrocybe pediades]